jgi:hypothetical protein
MPKKSKLVLASELEFNEDMFNDQPIFDPEPLDPSFDTYCDSLIIDPISSSDDEEIDNDSSREYDHKKDLKCIDDEDEDRMVPTQKIHEHRHRQNLEKLFGRKPRHGYFLNTFGDFIYEKRLYSKSKEKIKPLKPLKSFYGNGVEVEIRDSLIPGAGKGLFLSKTGTNKNYIPEGTPICLYDGVIFTSKARIRAYLKNQDGNDYLWQGSTSDGFYVLEDGQELHSSYGRFSNEECSHKNNNTEIVCMNKAYKALRVVLKSKRKIYLQEELCNAYGGEYFRNDRHRTDPSFLAAAAKYYGLDDILEELGVSALPKVDHSKRVFEELQELRVVKTQVEPVVPVVPVVIDSRKRTFEELQELRLKKKREALQLELEIFEIEKELIHIKHELLL